VRFHKIGDQPKTDYSLPEPEDHIYSELTVVTEGLEELLWQLAAKRDRDTPPNRDKAYVTYKTLYRLRNQHKFARNGRPDYPEFNWNDVERVAGYGLEPFAYHGLKVEPIGTEAPR